MSTPELKPCPTSDLCAAWLLMGGLNITFGEFEELYKNEPALREHIRNTRTDTATQAALNEAREALRRLSDLDAYFPMQGEHIQALCGMAASALATIEALKP